MISGKPSYYNIESLAKLTGLTRRTIRYYVQRGLISKPEGGGRGHYYTDEHLSLITKIKSWQDQGVPLEKMKELLSEGAGSSFGVSEAKELYACVPVVSSSEWIKTKIGESIELSCRQGALSNEDKKAIEEFIVSRIKK